MEQHNTRWERIQELAKNYGKDTTTDDKVKLISFVKEDIKTAKEELEQQLKTINAALNESGSVKRGRKPRMKGAGTLPSDRSKSDGKVSIIDAVRAALKEGSKHIDQIIEAVTKTTGKEPKRGTINVTLQQLKKKKEVKSVKRGEYELA